MNEHAKSLLGSASVDPDKVETVSHVDAMPQAAQHGGLGTQAREEALGNLLAVIHGDGGHRALEVGTKQAALEAEKIVANLLSSASEAREGEAVAENLRLKAALGAAIKADNALSRAVWAEGELDKIAAWLWEQGHQLGREAVADTAIVNLARLRDLSAAPSADKLRIGLDEIARLVNQSGAIPKGELRSILSTLKAEGA